MFSQLLLFTVVVLLLVAIVVPRLTKPHEHFGSTHSDSLPECNKVAANSREMESIKCQYIWKEPVYLPEGATVRTAPQMHFQDSTNASSSHSTDIRKVMDNAMGVAQENCKTNTDITRRVNAVVDKVQETIANDKTKNYYDEILISSFYMPYYVKMTDQFKYDVDHSS